MHGLIRPCCAGHSEADLSERELIPQRRWAIQIHNLRFSYPSPLTQGDPVPALRGIDLDVAEGEFVVLMGPIGAGKSTLCYALNGAIPHAIDGAVEGEVVVLGQATDRTPMGQLAMQVGLVFEDVAAQLFNATAADEVAFGLEGLGLPVDEIERRIDLALDLVGLAGMRGRAPRTLSGGEQRRLALASVLAMRPRVLVLDEPTQGLDPLARQTVIEAIDRLRREDGRVMTVIMTTLDAETASRFADRVAILNAGQIVLSGPPSQVFARVEMLDAWGIPVPQLARLAYQLSLRSGQSVDLSDPDRTLPALLDRRGPNRPGQRNGDEEAALAPDPRAVIRVQGLGHRYPTAEQWALADCSMDIASGEWLAIIGINGSGKSTLVKHFNGLLRPTQGAVCVGGSDTRSVQIGELARVVGYLPQNPDYLIFSPTVRQEVAFGPRQQGQQGAALDEQVSEALGLLDLVPYAEHPPAVLGYGLRRKVALASVLSMRTPVLALDEPTVGLDQQAAIRLFEAVSARHRQGTTVVMVTHDLWWVARYAQRVVVLYHGRVAAQGRPAEILADLDLLRAVDLCPLPITELAHSLDWAQPLPVSVEDFCARACDG